MLGANFRMGWVCVQSETVTPGSDILNEGEVKEGKPAPPGQMNLTSTSTSDGMLLLGPHHAAW